MRTAVGEIVEVQGGHIVRSTGRKDRHSKVCTAKGPRDRRVRLSAHTAIQFYDVQDRLGFDRPSKAVDWLIKKAKAAIDELDELPAWNPTDATITTTTTRTTSTPGNAQEDHTSSNLAAATASGSFSRRTAATIAGSDLQNVQSQIAENTNPNNAGSSFLPPSLDSDVIADTIKSFFPMGASAETPSASMPFQSYPPDLLSRTSSSHNQDLRLSLQSFQEQPMLLHQQAHQSEHQVLFPGTTPQYLGFDGSSPGWSEQHQHHHSEEMGRFQRMVAWNAAADTGSDGSGSAVGSGGFIFSTPLQPPAPLLQPLFGQNQFFSQRGPLQSSNTPSVRAWIDPAITAHHQHHYQIPQVHHHHQAAISSLGFASPSGGFSGFRIPARIQGEEEDHDGIQRRPSSASSDSRH